MRGGVEGTCVTLLPERSHFLGQPDIPVPWDKADPECCHSRGKLFALSFDQSLYRLDPYPFGPAFPIE